MIVASSHGFPFVGEPWASALIGLLSVVVITWIAIVVSVIRSIVRSEQDRGLKVGWIAVVLASQPLGVLLWLLIGRHRTWVRVGA